MDQVEAITTGNLTQTLEQLSANVASIVEDLIQRINSLGDTPVTLTLSQLFTIMFVLVFISFATFMILVAKNGNGQNGGRKAVRFNTIPGNKNQQRLGKYLSTTGPAIPQLAAPLPENLPADESVQWYGQAYFLGDLQTQSEQKEGDSKLKERRKELKARQEALRVQGLRTGLGIVEAASADQSSAVSRPPVIVIAGTIVVGAKNRRNTLAVRVGSRTAPNSRNSSFGTAPPSSSILTRTASNSSLDTVAPYSSSSLAFNSSNNKSDEFFTTPNTVSTNGYHHQIISSQQLPRFTNSAVPQPQHQSGGRGFHPLPQYRSDSITTNNSNTNYSNSGSHHQLPPLPNNRSSTQLFLHQNAASMRDNNGSMLRDARLPSSRLSSRNGTPVLGPHTQFVPPPPPSPPSQQHRDDVSSGPDFEDNHHRLGGNGYLPLTAYVEEEEPQTHHQMGGEPHLNKSPLPAPPIQVTPPAAVSDSLPTGSRRPPLTPLRPLLVPPTPNGSSYSNSNLMLPSGRSPLVFVSTMDWGIGTSSSAKDIGVRSGTPLDLQSDLRNRGGEEMYLTTPRQGDFTSPTNLSGDGGAVIRTSSVNSNVSNGSLATSDFLTAIYSTGKKSARISLTTPLGGTPMLGGGSSYTSPPHNQQHQHLSQHQRFSSGGSLHTPRTGSRWAQYHRPGGRESAQLHSDSSSVMRRARGDSTSSNGQPTVSVGNGSIASSESAHTMVGNGSLVSALLEESFELNPFSNIDYPHTPQLPSHNTLRGGNGGASTNNNDQQAIAASYYQAAAGPYVGADRQVSRTPSSSATNSAVFPYSSAVDYCSYPTTPLATSGNNDSGAAPATGVSVGFAELRTPPSTPPLSIRRPPTGMGREGPPQRAVHSAPTSARGFSQSSRTPTVFSPDAVQQPSQVKEIQVGEKEQDDDDERCPPHEPAHPVDVSIYPPPAIVNPKTIGKAEEGLVAFSNQASPFILNPRDKGILSIASEVTNDSLVIGPPPSREALKFGCGAIIESQLQDGDSSLSERQVAPILCLDRDTPLTLPGPQLVYDSPPEDSYPPTPTGGKATVIDDDDAVGLAGTQRELTEGAVEVSDGFESDEKMLLSNETTIMLATADTSISTPTPPLPASTVSGPSPPTPSGVVVGLCQGDLSPSNPNLKLTSSSETFGATARKGPMCESQIGSVYTTPMSDIGFVSPPSSNTATDFTISIPLPITTNVAGSSEVYTRTLQMNATEGTPPLAPSLGVTLTTVPPVPISPLTIVSVSATGTAEGSSTPTPTTAGASCYYHSKTFTNDSLMSVGTASSRDHGSGGRQISSSHNSPNRGPIFNAHAPPFRVRQGSTYSDPLVGGTSPTTTKSLLPSSSTDHSSGPPGTNLPTFHTQGDGEGDDNSSQRTTGTHGGHNNTNNTLSSNPSHSGSHQQLPATARAAGSAASSSGDIPATQRQQQGSSPADVDGHVSYGQLEMINTAFAGLHARPPHTRPTPANGIASLSTSSAATAAAVAHSRQHSVDLYQVSASSSAMFESLGAGSHFGSAPQHTD